MQVIGTFTFTNSGGTVLASQTQTFTTGRDSFFDTTYNMRWVRFMSFVPNGGKSHAQLDTDDMGYMKNAQFTGLTLYSTSGAETKWDASLVEHAWSVQTGNILSLSLGGLTPNSVAYSDAFSLQQRVWYGQRCITFVNQ